MDSRQRRGPRDRAAKGELCFGTVDSFLVWRLTSGRMHVTDATNASRTSLYNIHDNDWDDELLALFDVPRAGLAQVMDCASEFGICDDRLFGVNSRSAGSLATSRPPPLAGMLHPWCAEINLWDWVLHDHQHRW